MKEQPYIYPILYSFVKLIGFHFSLLIVNCLLGRICLRTALYLASFPKQSRSLCLRWSPRAIHSRQKRPSQHPQHAPLHKELQTRHWAAGNARNLRKTVRWESFYVPKRVQRSVATSTLAPGNFRERDGEGRESTALDTSHRESKARKNRAVLLTQR